MTFLSDSRPTRWWAGRIDLGRMRQKLPEQLEIVDEPPRTGLAKISKNEPRRRFDTTAP